MQSHYKNYQQIYTDGSKEDSKVGCAVISDNHSNMQRIPDKSSIFTAEAKAIDLALDFISTCDANNKFISSLEPKAQGELIVWDSSRRPWVRPFTLSNMNISETSWPIVIKFHQKHHWDGGLAAIGFGSDRIRTLVSMATESSYRVIMGKTLWPL